MLLNNFFTICELESSGFEIKVSLLIDKGHKIFDGHFPGQPVVPGVCMMQMVKEIIEQVIQQKLNLVKANEMKFLAIIDPEKNNLIQGSLSYVEKEEGGLVVTAILSKDEITHFKFKGQFDFQ